MEPSSAVMPEATLPPTRIAVSTGPSSFSAPKRAMFTAVWSARTMPVKSAAVRATVSERTPMMSTSRATSQKYEGGSVRLRTTRAASRPSPPYQTIDSRRWPRRSWAISALQREARHQGRERGAARVEGAGGRHVEEVVHARLGPHHQGLHRDLAAVGLPPHHRARGLTTGHRHRPALHDLAPREAEGEMAGQHVEGAGALAPRAGGVDQHPA